MTAYAIFARMRAPSTRRAGQAAHFRRAYMAARGFLPLLPSGHCFLAKFYAWRARARAARLRPAILAFFDGGRRLAARRHAAFAMPPQGEDADAPTCAFGQLSMIVILRDTRRSFPLCRRKAEAADKAASADWRDAGAGATILRRARPSGPAIIAAITSFDAPLGEK